MIVTTKTMDKAFNTLLMKSVYWTFGYPKTSANQVQYPEFPLATKSAISEAIHQNAAATKPAIMLPTKVNFIQSEESVESTSILVIVLFWNIWKLTIFFALFGDTPRKEPCWIEICSGGASEIILLPLSIRMVLSFEYVFSISKAIKWLRKWYHIRNVSLALICVFSCNKRTSNILTS